MNLFSNRPETWVSCFHDLQTNVHVLFVEMHLTSINIKREVSLANFPKCCSVASVPNSCKLNAFPFVLDCSGIEILHVFQRVFEIHETVMIFFFFPKNCKSFFFVSFLY